MFSEGFLLHVNGAGCCHGASVLSYDRQVGRPVVVRDKIVWLVVAVRMGGVVRDFTPYAISEVV